MSALAQCAHIISGRWHHRPTSPPPHHLRSGVKYRGPRFAGRGGKQSNSSSTTIVYYFSSGSQCCSRRPVKATINIIFCYILILYFKILYCIQWCSEQKRNTSCCVWSRNARTSKSIRQYRICVTPLTHPQQYLFCFHVNRLGVHTIVVFTVFLYYAGSTFLTAPFGSRYAVLRIITFVGDGGLNCWC